MPNIQSIVDTALLTINVIATGQTPSANERNDGLIALNRMLSSWSARQIPCLGIFRESFISTGSDNIQLGGGGATTRPIKLRGVSNSFNGVSVGDLKPLTAEEFAAIPQKGATATVAEKYFYDARFPLATIHLWPRPQAGSVVEVFSEKPISQFSGLSDSVDLPEGYERALVFGLASELWPQYSQAPISASVTANAQDAIQAIASMNSQTMAEPPQAAQQNRAALEQGMNQ